MSKEVVRKRRAKAMFLIIVAVLSIGSVIAPLFWVSPQPEISLFAAGIGVIGGVYFMWVSPEKDSCPPHIPVIFGLLTILSLTVTQALTLYRLFGEWIWVAVTVLIIGIEIMLWYVVAETLLNDYINILKRYVAK